MMPPCNGGGKQTNSLAFIPLIQSQRCTILMISWAVLGFGIAKANLSSGTWQLSLNFTTIIGIVFNAYVHISLIPSAFQCNLVSFVN